MDVSTKNEYQCRLCLATTETVVNIFEGDFIRMLKMLTSIEVQKNDGLPKYSCSKCTQDLEIAASIKERIIKSHKTLLDILENDKRLLQNLALDIGCNESVIIVNCDEELSNEKISEMISNMSDISVDSPNIKEENEVKIVYEDPDEAKSKSKSRSKTKGSKMFIKKPLKKKKCNVCGRVIRLSNFHRHVTAHNSKKSKCPICKRLISIATFKEHVEAHSSPSTCQICSTVCKDLQSLRGHIFYHHKTTEGQYVCEECGQSFRIKYKFQLHKKKAHSKLRDIKCEICKKGFYTNSDLKSHIKTTHEKQRPHVCDFCLTGFSSRYALQTHRRQHTDEKPFVCNLCAEGFRQRVSLRNHLKSKHGVEEAKEFFCGTCQKGFATAYALNVHERLHLSEKCPVCSESFGAEYLKIHLREEHNIMKKDEDEN